MNGFLKKILIGAAMTVLTAAPALALEGKWMRGDFHQHSYVTDGDNPMSQVLQNGFNYGLDWQANSEHGGKSDEAGDDPRQTWDKRLAPEAFLGNPSPYPQLWRWQTLTDADKVPAYLNGVRAANPGRIVINGMEMNMPGAEHCSTAIIDPTGYDIAQFEYLWDKSDADTSGGYGFEDPIHYGVPKNLANNLAKAAQAAAWMQAHFAGKGWMVPAHPERAADKNWSDGNTTAYDPNFFRTLNDAGPDVCFGFESAPGHQKESGRGGYSSSAYGGGTFGGVGHFAATVGGLWDALLGEGRNWWLFASSDFHNVGGDFWPGEYQKTYSYVTDSNQNGEYDGEEIVASLRSGNSFIVYGDLINDLQFTVKDRVRGTSATMGQTLNVRRNGLIEVTIRFKSPAKNNNGDTPVVRHVQLIAGDVTGKLTPGTDPYKTQGTNPSTQVVATYNPGTWTVAQDGYTECTYQVRRVNQNMYFRVRGNNLAPNTPNETDAYGNPLPDSLMGSNTAAKAWADLWFYSNPIFVQVN